MRPKYLSFEELVKQNRQELLNDENEMNEIELRLERRRAESLSNDKKVVFSNFKSY